MRRLPAIALLTTAAAPAMAHTGAHLHASGYEGLVFGGAVVLLAAVAYLRAR